MFDWIISGADRWAVLNGYGEDDGIRLLIAQRGSVGILVNDGGTETLSLLNVETEEEAVSSFYEALSHFQTDHSMTVQAQWTDAEVNAL